MRLFFWNLRWLYFGTSRVDGMLEAKEMCLLSVRGA